MMPTALDRCPECGATMDEVYEPSGGSIASGPSPKLDGRGPPTMECRGEPQHHFEWTGEGWDLND